METNKKYTGYLDYLLDVMPSIFNGLRTLNDIRRNKKLAKENESIEQTRLEAEALARGEVLNKEQTE